MSDRWEERGRKWDKGHHSVTCRLWKQFTLLEWAEGGRIQRRETGSKRNQFNTTEIHEHFHLIKALQDKSRTEGEQMRPTRSGQYYGRTPSQGRAFCLKTFHPLPLSPSDSLTLILTVGPLINSWQRPHWPELDCDALQRNWAACCGDNFADSILALGWI